MSVRSVITGIGVVAPTGIGVAEHWKNSLDGVRRIGPISSFDTTGFPVQLAGEVTGFEPAEYVENRLRVQTDRGTWLALAASRLAFEDAQLDPLAMDALRMAVVTASASGGNAFGQREIEALWRQGPRSVSAYQSIGWFYAASSGQISIRHQLKGSCGVLVADSAGGIDALAQARRQIRHGMDVVLVGATEAPLSPYALVCQHSQADLSGSTDPLTAYRPFHPESTGYVPAEGGAMLVLEREQLARARGARVYAEIAGTAATHDAYHQADPAPDSRQLARAVTLAIERADLTADQIDVVFADGAGSPVRDALEADAIERVFGRRAVPVAVPKTMTGRAYCGGTALDLAWATMAIAEGVIPPSVNLDGAGFGDRIDLVTGARSVAGLRTALVIARGAGGFNAAAVLRAPAGEDF